MTATAPAAGLPAPPPSAAHPLHLLDAFLLSIGPEIDDDGGGERNGNDDDDDEPRRRERTEARRAAVLRAADFLYGPDSGSGGSSSSLLEAALAVMEDAAARIDEEGGPTTAAAATAVRRIRASPSGRTAFLVRGSGGAGSEYVCLIGGIAVGRRSDARGLRRGGRRRGDAGAGAGAAPPSRQHCSCRSYYERTKSGDRCAVCKHLLAVKLAPFLDDGEGCYYAEEVVSDGDFAEMVVGRAFP